MDRTVFYNSLRSIQSGVFAGKLTQPQVTGMEGILNAFVQHGDQREKTLAYALATAYHETGTRMIPVREGFAKSDAQARAIVANREYAKPGTTGLVYYGRGHVQLTWESNYVATGKKLGIDLQNNPDMMLDPVLSARVLIEGLIDGRWNGMKHGIARYLPDEGPDDLKNARRTVNVTDRWSDIGKYYQSFLTSVRQAGGVPTAVVATGPDADPAPDLKTIPGPESESKPVPKPEDRRRDVVPALLLVLSLIEKRRNAQGKQDTGEIDILRKLLETLRGSQQTTADPGITPINAVLGENLGKMLDGKKTAIGVFGLLASSVVPVLFPESGDSILKAFDLGAANGQETMANGKSMLHGIFGALSAWGVLGKAEKWVHLILNRKSG